MFDVNRVTLVGRLGHKPELRYKADGDPWTWLRIVTNSGTEDKEFPVWHSVFVFNGNASACVEYLDKGSRVLVEGRINQFPKENDYPQNGIIANKVIFLNTLKRDNGEYQEIEN